MSRVPGNVDDAQAQAAPLGPYVWIYLPADRSTAFVRRHYLQNDGVFLQFWKACVDWMWVFFYRHTHSNDVPLDHLITVPYNWAKSVLIVS